MKFLGQHLLGLGYSQQDNIMLQKDSYEVHENYVFSSVPTYQDYFYKVDKIIGIAYPISSNPNVLM